MTHDGRTDPLNEPHIIVNARRDEFPDVSGPTAEIEHFYFPSRDELRQWFEDDKNA